MTNKTSISEIRVEARRRAVKRLWSRRMSATEIVELLQVPLRTIERDIAAVRAETVSALMKMDAITLAAEMHGRSETRQRELWAMFGKLGVDAKGRASRLTPAIANARLAILRELHAEAKEEVDLLQKLGVVYEAPREIRVGFGAVEALARISESDLQRLASVPVDRFGRELASLIGEEVAARLLVGHEMATQTSA